MWLLSNRIVGILVTLIYLGTNIDAFGLTSTSTTARLVSSCSKSPLFRKSNTYLCTANGSSPTNEVSLLEKIDRAGQRLKPMAQEVKEQSLLLESDQKSKKLLYTIKSCGLFSLFILYRAYRGFFVILPAVFRETYRKMKMAVDTPFDDEIASLNVDDKDQSPRARKRTKVVVSVLASFVVVTYIISGALKVLTKFLSTITRTSSIKTSFEAAADEVIVNEDKLMKVTQKAPNGESNGLSP